MLGICVGLTRNGPHGLTCKNAWPTGSATIRKFVLVGVGVAFLEEVYHPWGQHSAQAVSTVEHSLLLPTDEDVEHSALQSHVCLHAAMSTTPRAIMD